MHKPLVPNAAARAALALALIAVTGPSLGSLTAPGSLQAQAPSPPSDLFDPAVVRDFYIAFHDADWEQRLGQVGEQGFVYADLVVDGETFPDVGLRLKGNSSSRGPGRKKPLNLTLDAKVAGQDLMGYDTLNFNNGFADPTLAREMLALRRLADFLPMPRAAYARVHVNGTYFGLYTMVQQIERTFADQWFAGGGDGVLFKADPPEAAGGPVAAPPADRPDQPPRGGRPELRWLGEDLAAYKRVYELKTEAAGDEAYEKLRELIRVLDAPVEQGGATDWAFPEAIGRVLDVDGALWYLAAINLYTNYDSYYAGHNYFLYWSERDRRFHILSWDVNESFGVFPGAGISPGDRRAVAQTDPFLMASGTQAAARPLIRRLLGVPSFRADYLAHYRTLLGRAFELADLEARVMGYQDLIRPAVQSDPNLLYGLDNFARNVWEDVNIGRPVPGLLAVARDRGAWLAARDDLRAPDGRLASHDRHPEAPTSADEVRLALRFEGTEWPGTLDLVYDVDGGPPVTLPFQPGDVTFFAAIPAQPRGSRVRYYARAAFADGRVAFFPEASWTAPWSFTVKGVSLPSQPAGDLVINELLTDNAAGLPDPNGELDDWVELYNRGSEPIELEGYYLSDAADDPMAYALPVVTLAPGGYYLVWCDNDPEQGPDHADFRLSKDGEAVFLSTSAATVDNVEFGPQTTDVSWGRVTDGATAWGSCARPSPRGANRCEEVGTPGAPTPGSTAGTRTPTVGTGTPAAGTGTPPPIRGYVYLPVARVRE